MLECFEMYKNRSKQGNVVNIDVNYTVFLTDAEVLLRMKSAANTRVAIVADDVAEPQDIQVFTIKNFCGFPYKALYEFPNRIHGTPRIGLTTNDNQFFRNIRKSMRILVLLVLEHLEASTVPGRVSQVWQKTYWQYMTIESACQGFDL